MAEMRFLSVDGHGARAQLGSDLVLVGEWGFVSGLQGVHLRDERKPLAESVEAQTHQILANLEEVLGVAGMSRDNVVSVRVHLLEWPRFYERMNQAYRGFFRAERMPARSCIGVSHLTRGALIEMDFVVHKPGG